MKKITTILFMTGSIFLNKANAQGLYVNTISSYGFSLAPVTLGVNYSNNGIVESVRSSFGKGLEMGAGFGYYVNKNIGLELSASYLLGGKTEFTDAYNSYIPADEATSKGRMIRLVPAVKIVVGENLRPYMKFGFVMGLGCKIINESTEYDYPAMASLVKYEKTYVYSGGFSMGFKGNLGLDISVSDNLAVFGELNFISQSWAPKRAEMTKYLVNGEDKLSTLPLGVTETEFVDSYNTNTNNDPNKPRQSSKTFLPFSSWGVNVGIHYTFGKKTE